MCASSILGCRTIGSRGRGTNEVSLWLGSTPLACISQPHGSRASFLGLQFEAGMHRGLIRRPPMHGQPAKPNKLNGLDGQQCSWGLRSCTCACGSISPKDRKEIWNDAMACADRYGVSTLGWVRGTCTPSLSMKNVFAGHQATPGGQRPRTANAEQRNEFYHPVHATTQRSADAAHKA